MKKSELLRRMKKSKFFVIGLIIAVFVALAAFSSPLFVVHDPIQSDLHKRLISPEFLANGINGYILGTDALGQDIFTRLVTGCRISLLIAAAGVLIPALIGTALGAIAGYFGGTIDNVIMRICDIQLSIPTMVLAITVMAIFGNSVPNLLLVLAIVGWTSYTRVVRGSVMGIRNSEFIHASRVLGASNARILLTQILPCVLTPLIILMSQQIGFVILTEANLSFLGMGVPLPNPSLGSMIADGREYIATAPWTVVVPGVTLMIIVLAFNFLGDGVRDILDPKNKD
ncbi:MULTISPECIES: ABC transporter permease [Lacrimispora]|uniref:ABC transporter permease n=1 Tax=Lacrimispora TaxID=2719231 RepID=UPI000BE3798F|nr:ABC transporter permease [Lacrimispora amygdalina]MDK2967527.1 peptide/nickel transport system permease protein [Lacrimispora sp.]